MYLCSNTNTNNEFILLSLSLLLWTLQTQALSSAKTELSTKSVRPVQSSNTDMKISITNMFNCIYHRKQQLQQQQQYPCNNHPSQHYPCNNHPSQHYPCNNHPSQQKTQHYSKYISSRLPTAATTTTAAAWPPETAAPIATTQLTKWNKNKNLY